MSTDYGFKCVDCDKVAVIDNARYGNVDELKVVLANIAAIQTVRKAGLSVEMGSHLYNFSGALDLAAEHVALGHRVVVSDEYGRAWDECGERIVCQECATSKWCVLTEGHEEPHSWKRAQ